MKALKTFAQITVVCLTTLLSCPAWAGTWFTPVPEAKSELWVINTSPDAQTIWVAPPHRDGNLDSEVSFEVPARGRMQIPPEDLPAEAFVQIKSRTETALSVYLHQNGRWDPVPQGRSSLRGLNSPIKGAGLMVTNLNPIRQDGLILFQNREGAYLPQKFSIEGFEAQKFSLPASEIISVQVKGEANVLAHVVYNDHIEFLPLQQEQKLPTGTTPRFLLTNTDQSSSYVVEIDDPSLLQQAREQIKNPSDFRARILIGEIAAGSKGVNQDLLSTTRGSWSWHVHRVGAFAQFASQSCDGSPEFVEEYLQSWLQSQSPICFWGYRITQEI